MKTIVAGGRDFIPTSHHYKWLIEQFFEIGTTEVFNGLAQGADTFGASVANQIGIPVREFPADWKKHGRAAGPIRNQLMADEAEACILFPGGKGTQDMKKRALKNHLICIEYGSHP